MLVIFLIEISTLFILYYFKYCWGMFNRVGVHKYYQKFPVPAAQILASTCERLLCWTHLWSYWCSWALIFCGFSKIQFWGLLNWGRRVQPIKFVNTNLSLTTQKRYPWKLGFNEFCGNHNYQLFIKTDFQSTLDFMQCCKLLPTEQVFASTLQNYLGWGAIWPLSGRHSGGGLGMGPALWPRGPASLSWCVLSSWFSERWRPSSRLSWHTVFPRPFLLFFWLGKLCHMLWKEYNGVTIQWWLIGSRYYKLIEITNTMREHVACDIKKCL